MLYSAGLEGKASESDPVCDLGVGCFMVVATEGACPTEVSWSVEGAGLGEGVFGTAGDSVEICLGVPTLNPTMSLVPTSK